VTHNLEESSFDGIKKKISSHTEKSKNGRMFPYDMDATIPS
jgi:hypothetical protein